MKAKFQSDVWHLLKRNISKSQLLGYALANIVGLTVVLTGILFYQDSNHATTQEDKYFSSDYVVLSKKVTGIGFLPNNFSKEDIDKLKKQAWVKKIGVFSASRFAVYGAAELGGKIMGTYMFFESVPDEFYDVIPQDWEFNPDKPFVPVMLSKDYLALYNFVFAGPQGLPQVSEEVVGAIPVKLRITGENQIPEYYDAAVVGFSSRLNTIAVPQSFMDWANDRYAGDSLATDPSRLIVETDRLRASEMMEYLENEHIEIAGDKAEEGKLSDFLSVVSTVVTTNGFVISLLALFILLLSIFLLLQKSKDKLRNLMLLGYSPREVGRYYETVVLAANTFITLFSVAATLFFRTLWTGSLHDIGLGDAPLTFFILFVLAYLLAVTAINVAVIRYRLMQIWRNK